MQGFLKEEFEVIVALRLLDEVYDMLKGILTREG